MKVVTTTGVTQDQGENGVKGKVEKSAGRRFGYNYIVIKSYKESQKNDVVKCLYIKSLTKFGFCVIKEGTNGDTKDKQGRDIIDRLKWQKQLHEMLQDKVRMPRLLGSFRENGNYYLVIEHIKGKPFYKAWAESKRELPEAITKGTRLGLKFLNYLIQIAGVLEILHHHQIVHRDATANNFMIMPNNKVAVIDMELSFSVQQQFPLPAFQLGTYGYMAPQQEATETPTKAEDIYALGAIIFLTLTGISPGKLTNELIETLAQKISFFIPDRQISDTIIQCLHPDADKRPSAGIIKQVLQKYKNDLQKKVKRPVHTLTLFKKEQIIVTVQETINTLATSLLADEEKGWFADNMKPPSNADKHKLKKTWYASFNRGDSGILYMLSQAKKIGLNISPVMPYVNKSLERIRERYIDRIKQTSAGLHFGSDGIAAALAVAIHQNLIEGKPEYLEWIDLLLENETQNSGFIDGIAGQGVANLIAKPFLSSQKLKERLEHFVQQILEKQQKDGNWIHGKYLQKFTKRKKSKTLYGFAEGMAGTLYFLLEFAQCYKHNESLESAERGLKWLMKKTSRKKEIVQWRSSTGKQLAWWWGDGTAGIALVFIKAYEVTNNPIYKDYATGTLNSIPDTVIDNNLSQISGLSGLGEIYLEAWRVFNENVWLQRANMIAQVLMYLKKRHRLHGPYWLVESERHPVANFMVGNSGIIHFLLRYCHPDKIGLPLITSNNE